MKISYSAPGKTILSGEHAVVYGKPALITAISRRLTFTVWQDKRKTKEDTVIKEIVLQVKKYLKSRNIKFDDKTFAYEIHSEIPIGQNLGSSAALSVASSAAFLEFYTGRAFSKEEVNQAAYEIEKYFHGKPSGGDNSASCFGGLIYFRKEFEFLKNISSLTFKIPKDINDNLYVINSGKAQEGTAELVAKVGKHYNKSPKKIENVLNGIEKITKRMVLAVTQESRAAFGACIVENESLLEELQIVSVSTKKLLKDLNTFGVGKVTGAGGYKAGSGNIIFLAKKPKELEIFLAKKNISFLKFTQDFEGLRRE